MSDKPAELVRIDDLAANIRTTMARVGDVFSPSLCRQTAQIVSAFLRRKLIGEAFIYPGMTKMAKWGQCRERQARHNFSRLRQWGVVEVVGYPNGGRRASRFTVNFTALRLLLIEMGASPSAALMGKFRDAENPAVNPAVNEAVNPAVGPALTAAGIHTSKGSPSEDCCKALKSALRIDGGRDA